MRLRYLVLFLLHFQLGLNLFNAHAVDHGDGFLAAHNWVFDS